MCLVLTGIHAYLGIHVIAREVVFVDIALAQIAALGATAAFLVGFELESWQSYASGLGGHARSARSSWPSRARRRAPRVAGGGHRRGLRGVLGRRRAARRPRARTAPSTCAPCSSAASSRCSAAEVAKVAVLYARDRACSTGSAGARSS